MMKSDNEAKGTLAVNAAMDSIVYGGTINS